MKKFLKCYHHFQFFAFPYDIQVTESHQAIYFVKLDFMHEKFVKDALLGDVYTLKGKVTMYHEKVLSHRLLWCLTDSNDSKRPWFWCYMIQNEYD